MFSLSKGLKISWRYGLLAAAGVDAAVAIVAIASPLFLIYDTLTYDDRSGELTVKARRWLLKHYQPTEELISTALLRVRRETFALHDLEGAIAQKQGTIAPDLDRPRIMLADRTGAFFEIDLAGAAPAIRRLPINIQLGEAALLKFAAGRGIVENSLLRVWKLVILPSGRLAASYTQWHGAKKCVTLNVSIRDLPLDWGAAGLSDWRTVYLSQPCLPLHLDGGRLFAGHQAGGRLVPVGSDRLVLSVGDFQYDGVNFTPAYPEDRAVDYGKIFEIDLKSASKRVISIGHRNPQGLARDSMGRVWETEHGPQGGDELNLVVEGKNYGWPDVTLGTQYGAFKWPLSSKPGRHDGFEPPRLAWVPSIGVSNLIALRGFAPEWDGDLLVCSLGAGALYRLRLQGDRVVYSEPIKMGDRLRDIIQLSDGRVVLWTDTADLIVLSPESTSDGNAERLAATEPVVRQTIESCLQCHTLSDASTSGRISLRSIYGKPIAGDPAFSYSAALASRQGRWDHQNLDEFLKNPQKKVPGTAMLFPGISDDRLREKVIKFLQETK